MIITSGYNVYPSQIENILDAHEYVHMSCVIGVKDPYKMQKVKAFVMLKPGIEPSDAIKKELLDYCRTKIARYAMPYDIEFRAELPKTLVGKVAYRVLEQEAGAGDMCRMSGQCPLTPAAALGHIEIGSGSDPISSFIRNDCLCSHLPANRTGQRRDLLTLGLAYEWRRAVPADDCCRA